MKTVDREKIIITAALLHDLGKFFQRVEQAKIRHENEKYAREIGSLLPSSLYTEEEKNAIQTIIEHHHFERDQLSLPENLESEIKIVCKADRLSAHEREEREDEEEITKSVSKELLINHFSEDHKFLAFPILPVPELKEKDVAFYSNMETWKIYESMKENMYLRRIKEDLVEKVKKLQLNSWKEFIDSLLYILQAYLQFVPSDAYISKPSISLFDHLKTTALIADGTIKSEKEKLAIIVCEIFGIQKFITRKHKKLKEEDERGYAKSVRGRSFFITLLLDAIWRRIKDEFGVYEFNLIRSVGSLVAILPYKEGIEKSIEKIENEVNEFLWRNFGEVPQVSFGISIMDIKKLESESGFFVKVREAFQNASRRKYILSKEMATYLAENARFSPVPESKMCKICMRNEAEKDICESCRKLIELGGKIVKINKIYLTEENGNVSFEFGNFRYSYSLENNGEGGIKEVILYRELDFSEERGKRIRIKFFPFYAPSKEGNVLSFEEMCKLKGKENEYSKLAIFKSDIDNLSHLFDSLKELCRRVFESKSKESGEKIVRESISRYSFSVFLIDYFHFVFVRNLAKKHSVYVAYSGGDDTLIAGRIDNVLKFVHEFYTHYRKYLGKLTFSGGLAFASPKYPFRELSSASEEELHKAKTNKNSFSCFSIPVSWEEFEKTVEYMKKLYELNISRSKMYKIMLLLDRLSYGIEKVKSGKKSYPFEVYPYVLYFLRDLENGIRKKAKEFFASSLATTELENINALRLALRFSILLGRFEENGKTLLQKMLERGEIYGKTIYN